MKKIFRSKQLKKVTGKFKTKLKLALNTPESRKKRRERLMKIAFVASASVSLGWLLWNMPPTRKIILKAAVKLKSKFPERFFSDSLESESLSENFGTSNKQIIRKLGIMLASSIAALLIAQYMGVTFSISGKSEILDEIIEEAKNPTDVESAGIGPKNWPPAFRVLFQTLYTFGCMGGVIIHFLLTTEFPDIDS